MHTCIIVFLHVHLPYNNLYIAGKDKDGRPVTDGHDTFVLIASTIQEMEQWILVINRIIYQVILGSFIITISFSLQNEITWDYL